MGALKPVIDQWLAAQPRLQATRIHQDLVRDYGFDGGYNTVRVLAQEVAVTIRRDSVGVCQPSRRPANASAPPS